MEGLSSSVCCPFPLVLSGVWNHKCRILHIRLAGVGIPDESMMFLFTLSCFLKLVDTSFLNATSRDSTVEDAGRTRTGAVVRLADGAAPGAWRPK